MDAELKAKWVAALRSGKYRQGRVNLLFNDAYCCLGVLGCEMGLRKEDLYSAYLYELGDLDKSGLDNKTQRLLAEMNDLERADFTVIAEYIERNL